MTSEAATPLVLDTSMLIQAYKMYYPIDCFPGFWACLAYHIQQNELIIVDRVRDEVKATKDPLWDWLKQSTASTPIASTRDQPVIDTFSQMMIWVQAQEFKPKAKADFARVADGWVIAYAEVNGLTVVSQEVRADDAKKRVPLPNVCLQFGVPHWNTIAALRHLNATFDWSR